MHSNPEFWNGLPKVEITAQHIDRALKAMGNEIESLAQKDVGFEGAMIAGGVIAYIEALIDRTDRVSLAMALAEEAVGPYEFSDWVKVRKCLIDPSQFDTLEEHMQSIRAMQAAEIEAEVQKRLAEAA